MIDILILIATYAIIFGFIGWTVLWSQTARSTRELARANKLHVEFNTCTENKDTKGRDEVVTKIIENRWKYHTSKIEFLIRLHYAFKNSKENREKAI